MFSLIVVSALVATLRPWAASLSTTVGDLSRVSVLVGLKLRKLHPPVVVCSSCQEDNLFETGHDLARSLQSFIYTMSPGCPYSCRCSCGLCVAR